MRRKAAIVVATILIFGSVGAGALFVEGLSSHVACGGALEYDYDTGACEHPQSHPSSKGYSGTILAAVLSVAMGAAGAVVLLRSRGLR